MQQAINDWLIAYPTGTRTGYRRDINNFTTWLGTDPLNATRADIQRYLAHLLDDQRLQPSTVRRKASAISSFYDYCVQEKIILHSPAAHARRPRGDSAPKSGLPADQARTLIATAKDHSMTAHALVWLMAGAGLRITEACTANIEDISDDQLTVTVKGGHRQIKPLAPPVLAAALGAIGDRDHGPVLTNRDGDRLTRQRAWELVTRLTTTAGIDGCTPHTLRHTAATLALEAGAPVQDVQHLLGHRSIETTLRYIQGRDIAAGSRAAAQRLAQVLEPTDAPRRSRSA